MAPRARRAEAGAVADSSAPSLSQRRRSVVLGLAASLLPGLPAHASSDPTAGLRRWGQGSFRRFGFLVYEATLWAKDDPQGPPLALQLDYRRSIAGQAIAAASLREMRRLGVAESRLAEWEPALRRLFPDVRDGDSILGLYRADGARFLFNGQPLGEVADAEFARHFFAIWLDPRTSAPDLRAALLQPGGG